MILLVNGEPIGSERVIPTPIPCLFLIGRVYQTLFHNCKDHRFMWCFRAKEKTNSKQNQSNHLITSLMIVIWKPLYTNTILMSSVASFIYFHFTCSTVTFGMLTLMRANSCSKVCGCAAGSGKLLGVSMMTDSAIAISISSSDMEWAVSLVEREGKLVDVSPLHACII